MEYNDCNFYFEEKETSRKKLFEEALKSAKRGRVLYILNEELNELPKLSQEIDLINKQYMKMITFLYTKNLDSLIESTSTLPDWQSVPVTIILDDLCAYCNNNCLQSACGVVALLIDTAHCCSVAIKTHCSLYISIPNKSVDEDYCKVLKELYSRQNRLIKNIL